MKPFPLILLLMVAHFSARAQQPSFFTNASFEGYPGMGNLPPGWHNCNFTNLSPPDVFPASYGYTKITKKAFDKDTYLGMVIRENSTTESVGQKLSATLQAGQCYVFSLYLCLSKDFTNFGSLSGKLTSFNHPAVLRIWGGNNLCENKMLLIESPPVDNHDWRKFTFQFEALDSISHLMLEAYYVPGTDTAYNGHILVDNASPIIPLDCDRLEPLLDAGTLEVPEFSYGQPYEFFKPWLERTHTLSSAGMFIYQQIKDHTLLEPLIQESCPHSGFSTGKARLKILEKHNLEQIAVNVRQFQNCRLAIALIDRGKKLNEKRIKSLKRAFRFGKLKPKQYRITVVSNKDEMPGWLCGQHDVWLKVERGKF